MTHLHYYYYCPETDAYELDEPPIPAKLLPQCESYPIPTLQYPYSSPSSPSSSNDRDSFFGSTSDLSCSSSAYHQNATISVIPRPSQSEPVRDFSTAAGPSRFSSLDVDSRSSPYYNRQRADIHSVVPRPRHTRSASTLTKTRPVRPARESNSSSWRPFSLPSPSHVQSQTYPTYLQAPTSLASSCLPHGRHLNGACTCPPDFGPNPHGHPTPRSSYPVLQIDTSNKPNDSRPTGNRIAPPVKTRGPCISSFPFPSTSPNSPYLRSTPPSLPKGSDNSRRRSDSSEQWYTSCYRRTPTSSPTRLSTSPVSPSGPKKLVKRRSSRPQLNAIISSHFVPSHLSPRPLSSLDIASAKLAAVPVPPLTLSEYLPLSKKRHLTLRELADREEMADALRSARPTSLPLKQNSLPQKWKTRRINFLSSMSTPCMSYSDSSRHRSSTKTDALASLAWTGVVPTMPASPADFGRSEKSLYSSEHELQGSGINVQKSGQVIELKRGWSFAMAMADQEVTDEVLMEHLEKMRDGTSDGDRKGHQFDPSFVWMQHPSKSERFDCKWSISSPNVNDAYPMDKAHISDTDECHMEDAATWSTARRALLCCRELVRTEKRYQEELKSLLNGETTTPPPPLMLTYLPALLHASEVLLKRLSEDPSAWGVSTAFMGCEEELEAATVAWSGVAGQFFSKKRKSKSWRRPRSRSGSQTQISVPSSPTSTIPPVPPVPSVVSCGSGDGTIGALPPKLVLMGDKSTEKEKGGANERAEKADVDDEKKTKRAERKLSVRDLAIQPTQRVMRYVMLYRDLLEHTPHSSPSRSLVESALEAARRIAQKCDHAQDNAAFFPASPTSNSTIASPSD